MTLVNCNYVQSIISKVVSARPPFKEMIMAKRNNTSKSRPTRSAKVPGASRSADKSAAIPNTDVIEDAIEEERARLMRAHSLLNCVAIAMDAEEVSPKAGPHYPTLIETARDLVNESINRLDSMNLGRNAGKRKIEAGDEDEHELELAPRGGYSVREPVVPYGGTSTATWPLVIAQKMESGARVLVPDGADSMAKLN